jgi:hypothetical protein
MAASAAGVETRTDGPSTTWLVAGRPFALLADGGLEVRLDPVVGAAARRTPDTSASARGADWVRFAPSVLDQYAEDRARAWFASAHRLAAR